MGFGTFIIILIVAFVVVMRFLVTYLRQVTDRALTTHFRAAEAISDGSIPDHWVVQINRQISRNRVLGRFRSKKSHTELAVEKIDKLYRFFENSPFYENDEARETLLQQLQQTRTRWAQATWEELVIGDGVGAKLE